MPAPVRARLQNSDPMRVVPSAGRFLRPAAVVLAIAMLSAPGTRAAEVYRWVDENGRVQFGDRPPADAQVEQVDVGEQKPISGDLDQRRERRELLLDVMQEERAEESRARTKDAEQESKRRANCAKATETARQIEDARFIYEPTDDPYNPRVLDDAERARAAERARQDVAKWCR
ncbi:MAG TPA: DUF4124 domain-containing protein [Gammaproteobacteria bacterium]|jgi:hypothetical protein